MNARGLAGRLVANPERDHAYVGPPRGNTQPIAFHRTMPGYAPTPVIEMPDLARTYRVARIAVKNEQERLGLPSFKALGSSWALHQRMKAVADLSRDALLPFSDLSRIAGSLGPPKIVAAGQVGRNEQPPPVRAPRR